MDAEINLSTLSISTLLGFHLSDQSRKLMLTLLARGSEVSVVIEGLLYFNFGIGDPLKGLSDTDTEIAEVIDERRYLTEKEWARYPYSVSDEDKAKKYKIIKFDGSFALTVVCCSCSISK